MAKKQSDPEQAKKIAEQAQEAAVEEKVRLMLDPEIKDAPAAPETESEIPEATSAPELAEINQALKAAVGNAGNVKTLPPYPVTSIEPAVTDGAEPVEPEVAEPADPETDKAVDEIVSQEGDDLLAAEDETLAKAFDSKKPSKMDRIKQAWHDWWKDPVKKRATIILIIVLIVAALAVPYSRYFLLNTAGVRSSTSLTILDDSTQQPLKNVHVMMGNQSADTDEDGKVRLEHLHLGSNHLVVEKRAFAKLERNFTLGWGSNPLGDMRLTPTGSQYSFLLTDYLSGKPVDKVEAISDEASAFSDQEGKLKLTVDKSTADKQELEVIIKADEYREEKVMLKLDNKDETKLSLVPARKHVFISKRSGKYDVFKVDADGKNEERILAGTGAERDDMVLVPHPTKEVVALVSTRDNARNSDGFLLSTLTIIDLADNSVVNVSKSERIQIVDWSGDRLVYVQIAAGASAANPKRHRLLSYSIESGDTKELASSNYFNDVFAVNNVIYYAPSSAYTSDKVGLFKINADGSSKQTAYATEVWNVYRTEYDKLVLAVSQDWYDYKVSDGKTTKLGGEPPNLRSRIYVESADHNHSLWVDQRDGKGVLLSYDVATGTDKVLLEKSGLNTPVRWLNNSAIVFRVSTPQETADYIMSIDGGEPKKLKDVTNTSGIDRWYYY